MKARQKGLREGRRQRGRMLSFSASNGPWSGQGAWAQREETPRKDCDPPPGADFQVVRESLLNPGAGRK